MSDWNNCRKILCIRADNMGDIIMMTPALRALKERFAAHITLLTSTQGAPVCDCIQDIDVVIVADLPWVKLSNHYSAKQYEQLMHQLSAEEFDGAVIFTVYSQSALPAAMLCYQAGIQLRLAYARENPYALLTDWVPDAEPYSMIRHQVERELHLVSAIGAKMDDKRLLLRVDNNAIAMVREKLLQSNLDVSKQYIVVHTGVSEPKREYPRECWMSTITMLAATGNYNILLTGSASEKERVGQLLPPGMANVFNVAGLFNIMQLVALIRDAGVVVSVNTAIPHMAAATDTPVVVLYALTNPQHTPWKVPNKVLSYSVDSSLKSRNEVIRFVDRRWYNTTVALPTPDEIIQAVEEISSLRFPSGKSR